MITQEKIEGQSTGDVFGTVFRIISGLMLFPIYYYMLVILSNLEPVFDNKLDVVMQIILISFIWYKIMKARWQLLKFFNIL